MVNSALPNGHFSPNLPAERVHKNTYTFRPFEQHVRRSYPRCVVLCCIRLHCLANVCKRASRIPSCDPFTCWNRPANEQVSFGKQQQQQQQQKEKQQKEEEKLWKRSSSRSFFVSFVAPLATLEASYIVKLASGLVGSVFCSWAWPDNSYWIYNAHICNFIHSFIVL